MGRWWKRIAGLGAFLTVYFGVGALLHFVIFPEDTPLQDDLPRSGEKAVLPGGSTFIYRVTALESDGALFEADWIGEPGAAVPTHTHPSQTVTLEIHTGSLRVVLNGVERTLNSGDRVTIAPGVKHQWGNPSRGTTRALFQIRPAGKADFVFVQTDRAFHGDAGPLATIVQTIVLIGTHGEHTAWPIEVLRFLLAPTARLFGIQSYYPAAVDRGGAETNETQDSRLAERIADPSNDTMPGYGVRTTRCPSFFLRCS